MDAKNSPHALSPSSSNNGQEQLIPVRQNRPSTSSTSPPAPDRSNSPRIAGDEHTPCSTPPASDTDHQDPHRNPASTRPRKSRKPNNGKSALFWVHMDPQSVSEGAREDTLKSIRSHVMSEHNRKKRLESTRRYKTKPWKHLAFQPVETTASVAGQSGSSRAIPCPDDQDSESVIREEEDEPVTDVVGFPASSPATANPGGHHAITFANPPMKTSPWTYLGSGANDPFSMTHTPLSDRMLRHLQHSYPFHHWYGPKLKDHWASLIRLDPASLHACICVASSNSALQVGEFPLVNSRNLRSSGLVVDSFHHRGETIKLVNQGLSDPVKACSDELIAAVSMLLTIEIASGNPDHLKIHLAGLRQMVALRNSFTDVQPDIRFQVSWTDIRVACMTLTKPIFPAVRYARTPHLTIAPPTKELAVAASRLFSMMDTPGVLSTTMSRTISDLRELVWYAEWVKSNHQYQLFDQSTEEYFNTEVLYVEYCLHADRYNEYGEPKSDATIEGCIRLACLLFHNTFIWDFYPQVAPVLPKPILALRAALHATIGLGVFEPCQDLLIWLLFVGASSSGILLRDRAFFMRELAVAVGKRRIQSWHQLRDTLIPFFYVDRCYLTLLHDIWNELLTIPV